MTHLPTGLTQTAVGREKAANLTSARAALDERLDEMEHSARHNAANQIKRAQIGSGQRGDKRRTYRFQDDLIHDHETGKRVRCREFMKGNIEGLW